MLKQFSHKFRKLAKWKLFIDWYSCASEILSKFIYSLNHIGCASMTERTQPLTKHNVPKLEQGLGPIPAQYWHNYMFRSEIYLNYTYYPKYIFNICAHIGLVNFQTSLSKWAIARIGLLKFSSFTCMLGILLLQQTIQVDTRRKNNVIIALCACWD